MAKVLRSKIGKVTFFTMDPDDFQAIKDKEAEIKEKREAKTAAAAPPKRASRSRAKKPAAPVVEKAAEETKE